MLEGVTIPNGMSWSNDDKLMYFTDTPNMSVDVFDYEAKSGSISNRRVFFKYEGEGGPDGHTQDEHGNLWIAICGGGQVLQVSPEGKILAKVHLPGRMATCTHMLYSAPSFISFANSHRVGPALGGEGTLYVTSALEEDPEKYPESAKVSGSLFACHVGVKGQKPHRFRWNA